MDKYWEEIFRERVSKFTIDHAVSSDAIVVSIKLRIRSGCFHREHSPEAYKLIDQALSTYARQDSNVTLEEHETGPELLVFLAITTAGITLTKSLIDLITAIINARAKGIKRGDHPNDPVELIIRRVENGQEIKEEIILKVDQSDHVGKEQIQTLIGEGLKRLKHKN